MSELGLHTKSASTLSNTRFSRRRERYKLQGLIGELLPGERVASCGWRSVPGQSIGVYRTAEGSCFVGGVQVCGSVWTCPVCAAKIAQRRAVELRRGIEAHLASGGHVSMLTLTIDHSSRDALASLLARFKRSLKRMFSGRAADSWRGAVGYVGMVKAFEVTWGAASGWHPHVHILLFTDHLVLDGELRVRWGAATARDGFKVNHHGLKLEPVNPDHIEDALQYVTKWRAEHEMTYANIKTTKHDRFTPFDLARSAGLIVERDGERLILASLFREFAEVFKGTAQLFWSHGLRDRLGLGGELSDQEVAEKQDDQAELLGDIPTYVWRAILRLGLRADLLEAAEEHGALGVAGFCEWVWQFHGFQQAA